MMRTYDVAMTFQHTYDLKFIEYVVAYVLSSVVSCENYLLLVSRNVILRCVKIIIYEMMQIKKLRFWNEREREERMKRDISWRN